MRLVMAGCGNMGAALLEGMITRGVYKPSEITVMDAYENKAREMKERFGVNTAADMAGAVRDADIFLMAVKPQDATELMGSLAPHFDSEARIFVTIAAGLKVSFYRGFLKKSPVARVMPNTPAMVLEGASGVYFDGPFSAEGKASVMAMLESCGAAVRLAREELLDAVTGLSGSGPAYVLSFISALADGGVMEGLPRATARELAIQTVLGTAMMARKEKDVHTEELKDRITSPAGTTAEGLLALEEGAMRATVQKAVRQAARRSRELGGK